MKTRILGLWLVGIASFGITACMNTATEDGEEDVVWKGTKAYEKRVGSFRVKPQEAYELAWKKHDELKYPIYFREPEFIVGQCYLFGQATKTEISLAGYYVNGINGQVEYRQSEKTIKAGAKHLPRDAWQKEDSDNSIVWKGSRGYRKRVESFKIKPNYASKLVLEQLKKPGTFKLKNGGILGEGTFIVGRWYWFGTATKTEIYIAGYYVNGDTGKMEYRESDKVLKSDIKHLPRIIPLPET